MTQRELDARVASIQYTETTDLNLPAIEVAGDAFEAGVEWADEHPHWISVEDELPAEQNRWILTYNGTSINLLMLAGNGGWYDHSVAKHRNITHWMRIEPPKKGGEQ